jgi:hypothetical protein
MNGVTAGSRPLKETWTFTTMYMEGGPVSKERAGLTDG